MRVRVLAFASARDAIGAEEIEVELPDDGDLDGLREILIREHDQLRELWPRLAIAVDGEIERGDRRLAPGAEVALLPPVSGGDERRVELVDGPLAVADVIACVQTTCRGAVVVFLGNVRDRQGESKVERLTYEAYRPMATAVLERIVDEVSSAEEDLALAIHHRLGAVPAGETSVVIAAASPHRAAAYAASREALERLKREVPIWKREHYSGGSTSWREEEPLACVVGAGDDA